MVATATVVLMATPMTLPPHNCARALSLPPSLPPPLPPKKCSTLPHCRRRHFTCLYAIASLYLQFVIFSTPVFVTADAPPPLPFLLATAINYIVIPLATTTGGIKFPLLLQSSILPFLTSLSSFLPYASFLLSFASRQPVVVKHVAPVTSIHFSQAQPHDFAGTLKGVRNEGEEGGREE